MSPEAKAKLQVLRNKQLSGPLSLEEIREGIRLLRDDREAAAGVSAKSKGAKAATIAKVKAKNMTADDLFAQLSGGV
jgi:hypothetical protein